MQWFSYSPTHQTPELLDQMLVGDSRRRMLETLVPAVRAETGPHSHQHQLLIGPRGSGKTHLLTLLRHRLRTDKDLATSVLPIALPEEEPSAGPGGVLGRVVGRLHERLQAMNPGDESIAPELRDWLKEQRERLCALRDHDRAVACAADILEEVSRRTGRLLVPIIENLDQILFAGINLSRKKAAEKHWGLRAILLESKGMMVMGAAPSVFGEVTNPDAAFHDFFRFHHVEPLRPDEVFELFTRRLALERESAAAAGEPPHRRRLDYLAEHLAELEPRVRTALHFTGGLPRFAHLIFEVLVESDVSDARNTLSRFLDQQTPLFQPRLDARLWPQGELEVLDVIASAERPLTLRRIGEELRASESNVIRSLLDRLIERGLVRQTAAARPGESLVEVTDPLFRIWRRFKTGQTEQEQLFVLAEFVAAFYDRGELSAERKRLADLGSASSRLLLLDAALQCQVRQDLETVAAQEPDRGDPRTEEQRQLDADIAAADEERLHGNLKKALAAFQALLPRVRQQAPGERLALFLAKLSTAARLTGDTRLAMATAEEAESAAVACGSDRGRGHAILSRGDVLLHSGRFDEALAAFKAAEALSEKTGDDLGRGNATLDRGRALLQLGRCDEALAAFKAADALSEKAGDDLGRGNATWSRGEALFHLGRTEEALAAFKAAETLYEKVGDDIGRGNATRDRGRALCSMGEVDAGLAAMLEGHQMEVTVGCLHNAAISARRYLDALAAALEAPGGRERTKYWPGQVEAVAGHLKDSERVRGALVRLATAAFRHLTPRQLVDGLPAVEALLPPEYSTLLAPVRLAGEVRLGMRDERLPEEPDEMRRLVRELLK